jgi:hypothetical protein
VLPAATGLGDVKRPPLSRTWTDDDGRLSAAVFRRSNGPPRRKMHVRF